jgi:hypothetical protein
MSSSPIPFIKLKRKKSKNVDIPKRGEIWKRQRHI